MYVSTAFPYIYTCPRSDLGLSCRPRSRRRFSVHASRLRRLSNVAMGSNPSEPHTLETLTAQVKINYDKAQVETGKLKEAMGSVRQDMAELHSLNQDLMTAMTELKPTNRCSGSCQSWQAPWPHRLRRGCRGLARSCGSPGGYQDVWHPMAYGN